MFMVTLGNTLNCDAAVMITANHHPYDKNGLKFFTKGGLESADADKLLMAQRGNSPVSANKGKLTKVNFRTITAKFSETK